MFVTCPKLAAIPHARHGFFTRRGGKSSGLYASLNCGYGSGDDIETVEANRAIVASALGSEALCTAYQIHSATAVTLTAPWHWKDAPQGDALVTDTAGVTLGILTADCLPILFADTKQRVIGAAHAGWKGAFTGVIEATLAAMEKLGASASTIIATIGPAIAQNSYEVGQEFYDRFVEVDAGNGECFIPSARGGHFMFDLKHYAKTRLLRAGVKQVQVVERDTCAQEEDFFSFRRATLRGEPTYGRQISAITLI